MGPFTQEDPIGIAGGLNLYGYANGDPINFSDPFGLCPGPDGVPCFVAGALGGAATGASAGAIVGATGGSFVVPGVGTVAGGTGGAFAGGLAGFVAGGIAGGFADLTSGIERSRAGFKKVLGIVGSLLSFNPANPSGPEPPPGPRDDDPPPAAPAPQGAGDGGGRPRLGDDLVLPDGTVVRFPLRPGGG